jgi:hypothetical protein
MFSLHLVNTKILGPIEEKEDLLEQKKPGQVSQEDEVQEVVGEDPILMTKDEMLRQAHGGRGGHWGVKRTYDHLNKTFPGHGITIKQISEYITQCGVCEKVRLDMSTALVPVTRHLKNPAPRRVVGIDYLSMEKDKFGNNGLYVLRDHFSKLIGVWPTARHDAEAAATAIFVYCVAYGEFDYLMSDPGSEIMSDVVKYLNSWFGINHRVSLVDRHESNGVEGANKQILRHIRALVCDERIKDRWSSPHILGWVVYIMNKYDVSESGAEPYALMFGNEARKYFQFPTEFSVPSSAPEFIKKLDRDLQVIREIASTFQQKLVADRVDPAFKQNVYNPGEFVFFAHPDDKPLPNKLATRYAGPYEVLRQTKNDVECKHLAMGNIRTFYVGDLKPFFGTREEGKELAAIDHDQFMVDSIIAYRGNPHSRTTMEFYVKYADGDERWVTWTNDLFDTTQYEEFCKSKAPLWQLVYRVDVAKKMAAELNKTPITEVQPGDRVYVDIRWFGYEWYRQSRLPDDKYFRTFVVLFVYEKYAARNRRIMASCPIFNDRFTDLDHVFVKEYGSVKSFDQSSMTLVDEAFLVSYPELIEV